MKTIRVEFEVSTPKAMSDYHCILEIEVPANATNAEIKKIIDERHKTWVSGVVNSCWHIF